jgi:hypothetical protein
VGVLKAFLEPKIFQEAMDDPRWQEAMEQEMNLIQKNQTWRLEDLPPNKVPITCKWVYKVKKSTARQLEKLKARLVARGFEQTKGLDFNETFAPIFKWGTI